MRYALILILACLVLACPVLAAVFPCSNDYSGNITNGYNSSGALNMKTIPGGATVTVDPGLNSSYTGPSPFLRVGSSGTHSFTVSLTGYKDYTGQYAICTLKTTYVTAELTQATPVTLGTGRFSRTIAVQPITSLPTTTITTPPYNPTQVTVQATQPVASGTSAPQDTLGSVSVTTDPAGAFIFIDGVQRGISPATIPGLSAGSHTVLLKLDGYQDLSTPVTIAAGTTQDYTTAMAKIAGTAGTPAGTANATASSKKTPGFEAAIAFFAIAGLLIIRKNNP